MSQKSNVVKLVQPNPLFNEDTILLSNMSQILLEIVRQHGAKTTLTALQGMIQDAQQAVNAERKSKPVRQFIQKISNGGAR